MQQDNNYIAVDLGAESGRIMLGNVSDNKLSLEEIYRFTNQPLKQGKTLRWDFNSILSNIKKGITEAVKKSQGSICSIGIDSWGVDFGLIDEQGQLIENPYHYRDSRTDDVMEKAFGKIDKRQIYEKTGLQFMQLNTIYQLYAMRLNNDPGLYKAKRLLFTADLYAYYLCGEPFGEYTLASTSQLMDMRNGIWAKDIFDKLSLPINIMPGVVKPGTIVGKLTPEVAREIGSKQIPVTAIGSHDTASAVAAVPAVGDDWGYLSCGTWSLMGVEIPKAIINDKTFGYEFTNEGGVEGTIRLLKNIMGLWLLQESKRQWQKEGTDLSYSELTEMAKQAEAFQGYIDPDYDDFLSPGDMPAKINSYLKKTGQNPMTDKAQIVRAILESLALKYRIVIERIEDILDSSIDCLYMVGGGIQNELLCQFTANSIGKKIIAGPTEATAIGNILMQAKATGQVSSLEEIREIVRNSFELKEYQPGDSESWEKQYEKIKNM